MNDLIQAEVDRLRTGPQQGDFGGLIMEIEKEISQFCCCPDAELVDCQLTSDTIIRPDSRELIFEGICPACLTKIKSIFNVVR